MSRALHEGTASNRYTVLGRLAGGGMADIFLAKAMSEGGVERYVVLKRVLAERSRDPHFAKMFLDEARLAAQLQHPNIAQVHDIGKLAGSYFFTMEYVHGEDVRAVLHRLSKQGRSFSINHVLHVAAGALAALEHAHERTGSDGGQLGIVHRDVSPSNVMVSFEGVVKLLDFGVAKATQRTAESQSGTIKGKIAYLSPEQCQGHPVDRRSDIYSLGIVLWEMLVGKRLYKRETDFATMMAIVNEPAPLVSSKRPDVSSAIDSIVMRALAIDPAKRFSTAGEMLEAIENVAVKEQHVLSATSVGRFLRELFGGERPKPWQTLTPVEADDQPLTITGESISEIVVEEPSEFGLGSSPQMQVSPEDTALVAQLERAPAIRTSIESDSAAGPRLPEGTPGARLAPRAPIVPEIALAVSGTLMPDLELDDPTSVTAPPSPDDLRDIGNDPTAIEPPIVEPAPPIVTVPAAPIKLPGVSPTRPGPKLPGVTPMPEPHTARANPPPIARLPSEVTQPSFPEPKIARANPPPMIGPASAPAAAIADAWDASPGVASVKPRRGPAIAILLVLLLVGGVAVAFVVFGGSKDDSPLVAPDPITKPEPKPQPTPDPTPEPVASDPPPKLPPKPEKTIASLTRAKDWSAVVALCQTQARFDEAELVSCGTAACRSKRAPLAKQFRDKLPASHHRVLEGACRQAGVTLEPSARVTPPVKPPTPPVVKKPPRPPAGDPCESAADPLKCQK